MGFSSGMWIVIGLVWGMDAIIDIISDKEASKGRLIFSEIMVCLAAFDIAFFCN